MSWNCECGAKYDRDMPQIHSFYCPMYVAPYKEEKIIIKEEKKVDVTGWPSVELIERLRKEAIKRK